MLYKEMKIAAVTNKKSEKCTEDFEYILEKMRIILYEDQVDR